MDLDQFQFDFDLTFAVFFMNPDGTIYGRYGTRSSHDQTESDISLEGLREAMSGALALHSRYPVNRALLTGKKKNPLPVSRPEDFPSLARYKPSLDYQGAVAQSCMHCHQIRDAQRRQVRDAGKPLPDDLLYPYPKPDVLGLVLDVKERAKVAEVAPDSSASADGFKAGDEILVLGGQAMLSVADVQWVIESAPKPSEDTPIKIPAQVRRGDEQVELALTLNPGWRKKSDFTWRTTSWDLRRMNGGMRSIDLTDAERAARGLANDTLALKVMNVGQFGEHQNARRAGIQKDDVIVAYDGLTRRLSEGELLAHVTQVRKRGEKVPVKLLRGDKTVEVNLTLQ